MSAYPVRLRHFTKLLPAVLAAFVFIFGTPQAQAQGTEFQQAVAQAASGDADLLTFYRERGFDGIWSKSGDRNRRTALMEAFNDAPNHGLPSGRYDADGLIAQLQAASSAQEQGRLEVELSRQFLTYARDIQTGLLTPERIDPAIHRQVPLRSRLGTMRAFAQSNPAAFMRALPPSAPEYNRLMAEKMRVERLIGNGGWGQTVPGRKYERGDSGAGVVALRNRLMAMGFLERTNTQTFDDAIYGAVTRFQQAHGLAIDGTAGPGTLEQLNVPPEARLRAIIVAMERERWINRPRGERHIWVNITDFSAKIIDNGVETFSTRSVVGARESDRATPEFSDVMEFMVINPSWYVPRSIITQEFLPQLQVDPNAVRNLVITDRNGSVVDRSTADFSKYTPSNFPYSFREPPSQGNALGLVKFMFPNRYNIYLHDTPAKSLFGREVRAYSHGCVRLADPFDFAHALLSRQVSNPEEVFQMHLRSGKERRVNLETPVPVHLVYRTAMVPADGRVQFRRDVYGRDARIWNALAREGVVLRAVRG